jgi:hypothetical protein
MYGPHLVRKQDNFPAQQSKDTQFPYSPHSGPHARKEGVRLSVTVFPILSSTATKPVWDPISFVLSEYYEEGGGDVQKAKRPGYEDGLNAEGKHAYSCSPFNHTSAWRYT